MGTTGIPAEVYAGRYGGIVVIAVLVVYGARELRRAAIEWREGRRLRVEAAEKALDDERAEHEKKLAEVRAERDTVQSEADATRERLEAKVDAVRAELQAANLEDRSRLFRARQMLTDKGVPPEELP